MARRKGPQPLLLGSLHPLEHTEQHLHALHKPSFPQVSRPRFHARFPRLREALDYCLNIGEEPDLLSHITLAPAEEQPPSLSAHSEPRASAPRAPPGHGADPATGSQLFTCSWAQPAWLTGSSKSRTSLQTCAGQRQRGSGGRCFAPGHCPSSLHRPTWHRGAHALLA